MAKSNWFNSIFDLGVKVVSSFAKNGKSVVAYIMNEIPGITNYPGVVDAFNAFSANPNKQTATNLGFQVLFTVASGHRLTKLLIDIFK